MEYAAFGCALDALDAPEKVAMKLAYLAARAEGLVGTELARDPYDLLVGALSEIPGVSAVGRMEIESFLIPRPGLDGIDRVNQDTYRAFLDGGGCRVIANRLREFVRERVLPLGPVMVGVDHSLTGGVLEAIYGEYGPGEPALIVLDSHFDAIPTAVRMEAAAAAGENAMPEGEVALAQPPESYNCGTWVSGLLESGLVLPRNLSVMGVSDHPGGEPRPGEPEGIARYRESYLDLERRGVRIVTKRQIRDQGPGAAVSEALEAVVGKPAYVSIDADICAGEVRAVRFLDTIGLSTDECLALAEALRVGLERAGSTLAGMDIMEIDTHVADLPGSPDPAVRLFSEVARILLSP